MTVDGLLRRVADWTARQSLGPTSLSGVSLILAICAAIWFTAATRSADLNGAVALGVCYLAALGARLVASQTRDYLTSSLGQLTGAAQQVAGSAAQQARLAARQRALAVRLESIVRSGWLAVLGARLCDCAVLAGLAVGATAEGWPGMWSLAISVLVLIAIRDTMTACSRPPEPDPADPEDADAGHAGPGHAGPGPLDLAQQTVGAALTMPFGGRLLLIAVAAPVWGARASMLGLLDWGIIAVGYGIGAGTVARRRSRQRPKARRVRRSRRGASGGLTVVLQPPRPAEWAELHAERSAAQQIPVLGIRLSPAPPGVVPTAAPDVAPADPAGGLADIGLAADSYAAPDLTDPDLTDRDLTDPDVTDPDLTNPDVIADSYADPDLADPYLTHLGRNDPELADPEFADSEYTDSEAADPELADPELASPELASPGLAGLGLAGLGFTGVGLADAGHAGGPSARQARKARRSAAASPADPGLLVVLRCRDDGVISRWFGRLVRGQLMPLPPALLALAGVAELAHLGLGDLPGILILAPAIVMLVAAPGSSHTHSGRLDWLVPAVLQGAQYIYITALGMAAGVPVAVTFLLCTAIALRYADLGCAASPPLPPRRPAPPAAPAPPPVQPATPAQPVNTEPLATAPPPDTAPERGTWMGWEGRMLICGLGAAMGIAMFAYVALAAYVGGLICWKILNSCLVVSEGDSQ